MGLMDKLKDMFTEEVEVPDSEPIKKEVIQVEIPAPQKREVKIEDPEPIKKEEKAPAPVFFDDNDFANLEPPKKVLKNTVKSEKPKKKVEEKKVVKKVFKPTPIISPIYGILDKNYHQEDIKVRNNYANSTYNSKDVSIESIRKKAYGTLEDDLEITLFGEANVVPKHQDDEIDMFDELMDDHTDSVDDSDLFNLIDSVYEKDGGKNGN